MRRPVKTALNLWAKKLISYPMVRQNYIPGGDMETDDPQPRDTPLQQQVGQTCERKGCVRPSQLRRVHEPYYGFGIVTTGLHPTDLTREEENLYNLIVKRVLEAFTPGRTLRNRKDKERRRRRGQNRRRKNSAKPSETV